MRNPNLKRHLSLWLVLATLVGTAPNAMLVAFMDESYGTRIDFASWMLVGLPLAAVMLPLAWLILTRLVFKVDFHTSDEGRAELRRMKDELGPMKTPEKRVAIVFVLMARGVFVKHKMDKTQKKICRFQI